MTRKMARWQNPWQVLKNLPLTWQGWSDRLWSLTFLGLGLALLLPNLGELPLKDWDEGLVAQVARDIWRDAALGHSAQTWLHPTLGGAPYLNKPPLVHWLIALAYQAWGVQEWTARLPGALLTALSVPVLYQIGREIFPKRNAAVFGALVYVTCIPVVRLGRLAMLDGALLCFLTLLVLCMLKTRRDLRWGWGMGLAFGALCLTKGVVAVLLGAIALGFILVDTPRLLTSGYVWTGVLLGMLPVAGWYGAQWVHYGPAFFLTHFIDQALSRSNHAVDGNRGDFFYYGLEVLKYGAPWWVFLPQAARQVWENRNLSWAKLLLLWGGIYLVVISLMTTKLPWYVLPLYPAFALTVGAQFAELWHAEDFLGIRPGANADPKSQDVSAMPPRAGRSVAASALSSAEMSTLERGRAYPRLWWVILGLAAIAGLLASAYFGGGFSGGLGQAAAGTAVSDIAVSDVTSLAGICGAIALTFSVATVLIYRRDSQFILVLLWGMYVALMLFVLSPHWVWELGEDYPVKPVAAMVLDNTPPGQSVYTSHPLNRPSLNFYSDRLVLPATPDGLKHHWQEDPSPYLLIKTAEVSSLELSATQIAGQAGDWVLLTRPSV